MSKVSPLVDGLIEAMQCLPGVGPKSAQRMVLHLLERNRDGGIMLADIMAKAIEGVGKCKNAEYLLKANFVLYVRTRREIKALYVLLNPSLMFLQSSKAINLMVTTSSYMDIYLL